MTSTRHDLTDWLRAHSPISVDQILLFATALADELSASHAAGMVHGSLTPVTLHVASTDGRPTLVPVDRPRYQQVTGPTPADDVYAFGMVVRTLLLATNERAGATALPALQTLASQCTAADAIDRPTSDAMARQLRSITRDLLLGLTPSATAPAGEAPDYVPTAAPTDPPTAPHRPRQRWRTPILVAAGAALVLAITVGTVAIVSRDPSGQSTTGNAGTGTGTGTSAASRSPSPMPPRADPIGSPYLMGGSEVSLNEASGHGCRAWMNGTDPGPYAQGELKSAGDDCEMALWRSRNGGRTFAVLSGVHRIRSGTASTKFYWAGDSYLIRVCLTNHTTTQSQCGTAFGAVSMPPDQ